MTAIKTSIIGLVMLCGLTVLPAHASIILADDFNDGTLDPAWSITFEGATGWTYTESGTNLTVTDIQDPTDDVDYGKVILSQSFTPLTDFQVDFDFSWTEADLTAIQDIRISLYDADGYLFANGGFHDPWSKYQGGKLAWISGGDSFWDGFFGNTGSDRLNGTVSLDISRIGSDVNILWNGSNLVSRTYTASLSRVDVEFWTYYFTAKQGWPTSSFGSESVNLVRVEGQAATPIPEPSTYLLFVISICGILAYHWRRKKEVRKVGVFNEADQQN